MSHLNVSGQELHNLVSAAGARNPDAWGLLYRRSYRPLFAYARRRLADPARVDDAVSETFQHAYNRIGDLKRKGSEFDAWIFGIMRGVVFDFQRSRPLAWNAEGGQDSEKPAALQEPEAGGPVGKVRAAFKRLPPDDQEMLELRVLGGLASQEVADVLGRNTKVVRAAQTKALDTLRKYLAPSLPDPASKSNEGFESDRLLDQLSQGLMEGVPEGPEEGIAAVRARAIARNHSEAGSKSRGPAVALTVFLVLVALVSGLLIGSNPPDPIRTALARLDLPVESVEMHEARESMDSLAAALNRRDQGAAATADATMMRKIRALESAEQEELMPLAQQLHLRALQLLPAG